MFPGGELWLFLLAAAGNRKSAAKRKANTSVESRLNLWVFLFMEKNKIHLKCVTNCWMMAHKLTFFQVSTGVGTPTTSQLRYTWEPLTLYTSPGGVTMSGAADRKKRWMWVKQVQTGSPQWPHRNSVCSEHTQWVFSCRKECDVWDGGGLSEATSVCNWQTAS